VHIAKHDDYEAPESQEPECNLNPHGPKYGKDQQNPKDQQRNEGTYQGTSSVHQIMLPFLDEWLQTPQNP
jgi:hypothetical protein